MVRMIKIDFRAMKYYWSRSVAIPIAVLMAGLIAPLLVLPYTVFIMFAFSINPFAVEEKGKLDNLYLTLPISRKTIVRTRFALSLLMHVAAYVFSIPLMLIFVKFKGVENMHIGNVYFGLNVKMVCLLIAVCFLLYAILNATMFPILFKVGYAKGKIIGYYLPIIIMTVIVYCFVLLLTWSDRAIEDAIYVLNWAASHIGLTIGMILAVACLLLWGSYALSLRFYGKREF